ncbi:MAG: DUF4381 family protein [Thiobacillus sp.]
MDKQVLLDIVAPLAPPPAPPPYGWIALGVLCALMVVVGAGYGFWRRTRPRRAAWAQLQRTAQALREGRVDPRTAAFQTGSALHPAVLASDYQATGDWAGFLHALDQARFARQIPSVDTSEHLIVQARDFLRARC